MFRKVINSLPLPARRAFRNNVIKIADRARVLPNCSYPLFDIHHRLPNERIRTVFDVGAHHGSSALRYREEFPDAKIYSFEPDPETYCRLAANVRHMTNVVVNNIGLGEAAGELRFDNRSEFTDMHRIAADQSDTSLPVVPVSTIDLFCKERNVASIDYLKVDTEGNDLAVLRGAGEMLKNTHIINTECGMNSGNTHHVSFFDVHRLLSDNGFEIFGFYEQVSEFFTNKPHLRRANVVFISRDVIARA